MTTQEIKDLVAAKIAGQGNQVDIAGALPVILGEIVDILAKEMSSITISYVEPGDYSGTKSEAATALGIKEEQVDDLFSGKFTAVKIKGDNTDDLCNRVAGGTIDGGSFRAKYGTQGILVGMTAEFFFDANEEKYSWSFNET